MNDPIADPWSDRFNELDTETRKIACAVQTQTRINDLKQLKLQILKNHRRERRWINDMIRSLESWKAREFPASEAMPQECGICGAPEGLFHLDGCEFSGVVDDSPARDGQTSE